MQTTFVLAVGASFILAGFVKGVVGLGLPTVAMGLLGLVMPPLEAAALLIVPSMVTNVWQQAAGLGGELAEPQDSLGYRKRDKLLA